MLTLTKFQFYSILGQGIINGDFTQGGDDSGSGQGFGQGVTNIQSANALFQAGSAYYKQRGIKANYTSVIKLIMARNRQRKMNRRLDRFIEYNVQQPNQKRIRNITQLEYLENIIGSATFELTLL